MRASRVAFWLTVVTALAAIVDTVITASHSPLLSEQVIAVHGWPFVSAAAVGSTAMGALIISRYARHPIGWLLCLIGTTSSVSVAAEAYSIWVTSEDGPGSAELGNIAGWASDLVGGRLSIAVLTVMFLLAPDGRLLSRRWTAAVATSAIGFACLLVSLILILPWQYDIQNGTGNDAGGSLSNVLAGVGIILIGLSLAASVVSLIQRLRASEGMLRQQLRWIASAAALGAIGLAILLGVQSVNGGRQTWISSLTFLFSYTCLPVAFAIAVLRYRLYSIEVIINRAVVLAVVTILAFVGYATLVVGAGRLVQSQSGRFSLSLLATASVALVFHLMQGSVVQLANRLAYGVRALPYETLAEFSRRVGATPSPAALLPAVAEAAGRAVSARRSTATLGVLGGPGSTSSTWPADTAGSGLAGHEVEVRSDGALLGTITIEMARGRRLGAADESLLRDVASQSAVAFRNVTMEAQLTAHVSSLKRTTSDLADSRRRIIEADDAARRRLESAISREVLPHLDDMPQTLRRLRSESADPGRRDQLDTLVDRTNAALQALRQLTRGVFPAQLARAGLAPALTRQVGGFPGSTLRVDPGVVGRRFPARVEAAMFLCCTDAMSAVAEPVHVEVCAPADRLVLEVIAAGGRRPEATDLEGLSDRIEAVGGTLVVDESECTTTLRLTVPVDPSAD